MKRFFVVLLSIIIVLGALAGAGYAGFRVGYAQGSTASGNAPMVGRYHMNPNQMPFDQRGFGFEQHGQFNRFPMMDRGYGIRFFSPFHFIWNIIVLGLIIWFVYWLFTKSGWRITKQTDTESKLPISPDGEGQ